MQIRNLDLDTPAGHAVLYAMNNMRVKIETRNGEEFIGVLSVPAHRHPRVVINTSDTEWKPVRIPRTDVASIHYLPED